VAKFDMRTALRNDRPSDLQQSLEDHTGPCAGPCAQADMQPMLID
jgi:hypothetical protein